MRKNLILSAAVALAVGGTAMAQDVSYNFGQGGLVVTDANNGIGSGLGIGISGEAEVWEFLYGFVDVGTVKYSPNYGDITFMPASLGVGAHWPLGPVEVFGGLSVEHIKVKYNADGPGGSSSNTDSGLGVTAGARGIVLDNIQWSGSIKHRDLGSVGNALTLGVSAHYYFTPNMAAGVNLSRTDYGNGGPDETAALFNFRYDFSSMR